MSRPWHRGTAEAEAHFVVRLAPRRVIGVTEFAWSKSGNRRTLWTRRSRCQPNKLVAICRPGQIPITRNGVLAHPSLYAPHSRSLLRLARRPNHRDAGKRFALAPAVQDLVHHALLHRLPIIPFGVEPHQGARQPVGSGLRQPGQAVGVFETRSEEHTSE